MKQSQTRISGPLPMPRFADRLQDGEQLLWEGRPDVGQFIRPKAVSILVLTLPLIPLIMVLGEWKTGGSIPAFSPVSWVISTGAWLVGCWYSISQTKPQALTAAYALSNRRVFIRRLERLTSQDYRPKIEEISLSAIRPKLRPLGRGLGTITLGLPGFSYEKALRAIPDAAAVYGQLTQAQAFLSEPGPLNSQASGPYYAKTESVLRSEAVWKLDDILRRGEAVLWEGGSDFGQVWRAEMPGLIGLIVVLSAVAGIALFLNGWWTPLWQGLTVALITVVGTVLARVGFTRTASNRRYALTNRRVIVIKNARSVQPQVDERELTETGGMRLKQGRNGFGTIIFEKKTRYTGNGHVETYEYSFKHIADVEAVYGQIQTALRGYAASV